MYRSCVAEAKLLCAAQRSGGGARRLVCVTAAVATAAIAIVDPVGGIGALRASEMPRFIAERQLRPLQEALLAYTAQATASQADAPASFDISGSNRHPGDGMPPELLGAPELITGRLNQLTTTEFQSTLNAARRDAGEARALADEMSRRANEISDRFPGGGGESRAQEASRGDDRGRSGKILPANKQIADPRGGDMSGSMGETGGAAVTETLRKDAERRPAPVPPSAVLQSRRQPVGSQPVEVGGGQPPVPERPQAAGSGATDIVDMATPSRPAPPEPLPGLMSLGGSKNSDTASVSTAAISHEDESHAAGVATPPRPSGAPASRMPTSPSVARTAPAPSPVSIAPAAGPAPVESARSKALKAAPTTAAAAAAYGYVPLSPPKDRTKKRVKLQSDPAPPAARSSISAMTNGGHSKPEPKSAVLPAVPEAKAPGKSASAGEPPSGASQLGAGESGDESKEKKGLFSWFKPLGKPIEMPREIRAFGWSND